jgi:hypothetical protein
VGVEKEDKGRERNDKERGGRERNDCEKKIVIERKRES